MPTARASSWESLPDDDVDRGVVARGEAFGHRRERARRCADAGTARSPEEENAQNARNVFLLTHTG
jgi:hypothetical protein